MTNLVHDSIGWLHLIASILSLIAGTMVLLAQKGTTYHKRAGYIFTISMLVVLVTAMLIYRLFNRFGPFHVIAIIGFVYLAIGIVPALLRSKNWLKTHIYFMYWSVIGLYAAFTAEVFVRIPRAPFWWAVGLGTALIATLGGVFYGRYKKSWSGILNRG